MGLELVQRLNMRSIWVHMKAGLGMEEKTELSARVFSE